MEVGQLEKALPGPGQLYAGHHSPQTTSPPSVHPENSSKDRDLHMFDKKQLRKGVPLAWSFLRFLPFPVTVCGSFTSLTWEESPCHTSPSTAPWVRHCPLDWSWSVGGAWVLPSSNTFVGWKLVSPQGLMYCTRTLKPRQFILLFTPVDFLLPFPWKIHIHVHLQCHDLIFFIQGHWHLRFLHLFKELCFTFC